MNTPLGCRYLGLNLRSPLVASASPLTGKMDGLLALEDAGIAAVVLPSLFEEQIEHDELELARLQDFGADASPEALSYFPEATDYNTGPDRYLELVAEAKRRLSVPVIGSLNGTSPGGWVRYARLIQEAGADALELNIYDVPADPDLSGRDVEDRVIDLVGTVRAAVSIPLAVKTGPYFSSLLQMFQRLKGAGADALVLFNRFMQPDIDLDALSILPKVELSTSAELRLALRWIAIVRGRMSIDLAATSGVHRAEDALKLLLVGADVTMMTSALLKHGAGHVRQVEAGIRAWMEANEYASVDQLRGSLSQQHCADPHAFERANYMKALVSYTG